MASDTRGEASGSAVFLVGNDMRTESRVRRHASAASRAGYEVTVLALRSPAAPLDVITPDGYTIQRIGRPFQDHPLYLGARRLLRGLNARAGSDHTTLENLEPDRPSPVGPSPSVKRRIRDQLEWRHVESLGRAFTRHLTRLRPQVVVSNDLDTLAPAALYRRGHPHTRLVHDLHDLLADVNEERSTWWTPALNRVEARDIDAADTTLTVNPGLAGIIRERYLDTPVSVVRNAVSLDFGIPPERTRSPGPLRLAYSGGLDPRHGLLTLIDAMARLPGGTTSLDVYGFGELADVLPEAARARVPGSRVTVHPPVTQRELIERLNACEVGVLPLQSRELNVTLSTPNKLYEYMAGGLAVATFDGVETAGLVRQTGIGAAFDARDPGAIAATLDRFRRDPDHLAGCRARAWDAFRTRYNWEHEQPTFLAALSGRD